MRRTRIADHGRAGADDLLGTCPVPGQPLVAGLARAHAGGTRDGRARAPDPCCRRTLCHRPSQDGGRPPLHRLPLGLYADDAGSRQVGGGVEWRLVRPGRRTTRPERSGAAPLVRLAQPRSPPGRHCGHGRSRSQPPVPEPGRRVQRGPCRPALRVGHPAGRGSRPRLPHRRAESSLCGAPPVGRAVHDGRLAAGAGRCGIGVARRELGRSPRGCKAPADRRWQRAGFALHPASGTREWTVTQASAVADWYVVEVRGRDGAMLALSNPIFLDRSAAG